MNAFLFNPKQRHKPKRRKEMNQQPQSPLPTAAIEPTGNEQMQEKECIAIEDKTLSAVQILAAQINQAHERDDNAPLFIP